VHLIVSDQPVIAIALMLATVFIPAAFNVQLTGALGGGW
jgi:uncharacterized membrane-anchored protein